MANRIRRAIMHYGCLIAGARLGAAVAKDTNISTEDWISETVVTKSSDSPLKLQRFREPIWVLLEPILWSPSKPEQKGVTKVVVPKHFVTDLASIPSIFWSLMPRDDVYAYPAIVHDFLYWTQDRPRLEADEIFKWSMEDLEVSKAQVSLIYNAVRVFGERAWIDNLTLRARGERRILKEPPPTVTTRWSDWRVRPELFL